jgi:hypothetical protein
MNSTGFRAIAKGLRRGITLALVSLLLTGYFCASQAQVAVTLMPVPNPQYFDNSGLPLAFGCVFTYQLGTTTPLASYSDRTGTVPNANPVILDASGFASNGSSRVNIFIQAGAAYTVKVASSGGTNCASGSTIYTVDGIGGGTSQTTTNVSFSSSPSFSIAANNQLFVFPLNGNATANPLSVISGILPPAIVTFKITQDVVGGHSFSWPANSVGGTTVCQAANCVTQQTFVWDGSSAQAVGAATFSTPADAVPNLFDFGLTASSGICVNSTFEIVSGSSCNAINTVVINGQTIFIGGTGSVNNGAATHSMALNEGNGNPITGLLLANNQIAVGQTSADPVASTIPTCTGQSLTFSGTLPLGCNSPSSVLSYVRKELSGDVAVSASTNTVVISQAVTMPASGCPCRAFVAWTAGVNNLASSGNYMIAISDGTNLFAVTPGYSAGSINTSAMLGMSGSGWSHQTYANNANVTFTMRTESTFGTYTVPQVMIGGLIQNSGMDITIFPSN